MLQADMATVEVSPRSTLLHLRQGNPYNQYALPWLIQLRWGQCLPISHLGLLCATSPC